MGLHNIYPSITHLFGCMITLIFSVWCIPLHVWCYILTLTDPLAESVCHIGLFRLFASKTLELVQQLQSFFLRGIVQKGKGNCFMLTQCHAGLRSWKWRRKFLAGTFCGAKIQSLCPVYIFLTSPVGPKINRGNVGTNEVGPILNDCNGKHEIYLWFCFTIIENLEVETNCKPLLKVKQAMRMKKILWSFLLALD